MLKKNQKMSLFISERPKTTYILIHRLFLDRLYHIIRIITAHPAPEGLVLLWELKRALAWFSCSSCFTWDSSLKMNLRRQDIWNTKPTSRIQFDYLLFCKYDHGISSYLFSSDMWSLASHNLFSIDTKLFCGQKVENWLRLKIGANMLQCSSNKKPNSH